MADRELALGSHLSADDLELLHLLVDEEAGEPTPPARLIPRRRDRARAELSFAQQRLWFLYRLEPRNVSYNVPLGLELEGELDVLALRRAIEEVVRRHEVLRTTFVADGGQAHQVVHAPQVRELPLVDLTYLGEHRRRAAASGLAARYARRPFDLERGPVFRTVLLRLRPTRHVQLGVLHHIVADAWSLGVLVRELRALYGAYTRGRRSPLPPLPVQYAEYAEWQRERLDGGVLEAHLAFWRRQLTDLPALAFATDRPRPANPTFRGADRELVLSPAISAAVVALGRRRGATLFMTLMAALQALLSRLTGQVDIAVGTAVANRDLPEVEDLIGLFVNSLVLRTDLSRDPTFDELLARVHEVAVAAFAHADLPFERQVDEVAPARDLSRHPLFQVALAVQNAPRESLALPGLELRALELETVATRCDLELHAAESEEGLSLVAVYGTELFDATTVGRFLGHFRILLAAAVAEPSRRLGELPLMSNAERQAIEVEWNRSPSSIPTGVRPTLNDMLAAQAASTPDALAVVSEAAGSFGAHLSYGGLRECAGALARRLGRLGVGPEVRVGIFLKDPLDRMIAVLGILGAGGAYLPLDPALPAERTAFMLGDAAVGVVVSRRAFEGAFPVSSVRLVCLEGGEEELPDEGQSVPRPMALGLANVIHTSGSAGEPKGVGVSQGALADRAAAMAAHYSLGRADRSQQLVSLSFDVWGAEVYPALVSGGTVVLVPDAASLGPEELLSIWERQRVSKVNLPASYWHRVVDALDAAGRSVPPSLRVSGAGGEDPSAARLRTWARRTRHPMRFFNHYGPTEATILSVLHSVELGAGPWRGSDPIPIGRPLSGASAHVLDRELRPQPAGVPSELYLGGDGLARGYLGRPRQTALRFLADPFAQVPGARLYRTGDRVRWRADGTLEFLGRADHQVKLRGLRIELGEIEAVLRRHSAVKDCAVVEAGEPGVDPTAYRLPAAAEAGTSAVELWPVMSEHFVYDDVLYGLMVRDERRLDCYRQALTRCAAGRTVVEIGTGPEAVLARMAVEEGARKVYALELLEGPAERARATIAKLGLDERVTVVHGDSTRVDLPEKADVCVSALVGAIGGSEGAAFVLNDAHRFLRAGGVMLPERGVTRIAAVTLPDKLMRRPAFSPPAIPYVNKYFARFGRRYDLRLGLKGVSRRDLISDAGILEDLDFRRRAPLEARHEVELVIRRAERLDGFLAWLDLRVLGDLSLDVLEDEHVWLPVFLPAFGLGVEVAAGSRIRARVSRTLCATGRHPEYRIEGHLLHVDGRRNAFSYTSFSSFNAAAGERRSPFYERLFADRVDGGDGKRLVAFVVPGAAETSTAELRPFLATKLPGYMVPAAAIAVASLPLTSHGKVDRAALERRARSWTRAERPVPEETYVAPRTVAEELLAATWREVLGLDRVGVDDDFFALGGQSFSALQVASRLGQGLGTPVPVRLLFEAPTISRLATAIETLRQGLEPTSDEPVDLAREAVLDPSIRGPGPASAPVDPSRIFVTGATGFLGAALLHDLLNETAAEIYCLVRAKDAEEGGERIRGALERMRAWRPGFASRIVPVPGHLGRPLLGLSPDRFGQLAAELDAIYHAGALVSFSLPYRALEAVNVSGTHEVLRLASSGHAKHVHHVSTLSVLEPMMEGKRVFAEQPLGTWEGLSSGYAESKWVAEKLTAVAAERGLPVAVYRPAYVSGHSRSGVVNTGDVMSLFFESFVRLGCAPPLEGVELALIPVDYLSRAIVRLSKSSPCEGKVYHLVSPQRIRAADVLDRARVRGYPIETVPFPAWKAKLLEALQGAAGDTLLPLAALIGADPTEDWPSAGQTDTPIEYAIPHVLEHLPDLFADLPSCEELCDTYLDYYEEIGIFRKRSGDDAGAES